MMKNRFYLLWMKKQEKFFSLWIKSTGFAKVSWLLLNLTQMGQKCHERCCFCTERPRKLCQFRCFEQFGCKNQKRLHLFLCNFNESNNFSAENPFKNRDFPLGSKEKCNFVPQKLFLKKGLTKPKFCGIIYKR